MTDVGESKAAEPSLINDLLKVIMSGDSAAAERLFASKEALHSAVDQAILSNMKNKELSTTLYFSFRLSSRETSIEYKGPASTTFEQLRVYLSNMLNLPPDRIDVGVYVGDPTNDERITEDDDLVFLYDSYDYAKTGIAVQLVERLSDYEGDYKDYDIIDALIDGSIRGSRGNPLVMNADMPDELKNAYTDGYSFGIQTGRPFLYDDLDKYLIQHNIQNPRKTEVPEAPAPPLLPGQLTVPPLSSVA